MLVGAGGHFCPVARLLNGPPDRAALVAAQEAEFPIGEGDALRMRFIRSSRSCISRPISRATAGAFASRAISTSDSAVSKREAPEGERRVHGLPEGATQAPAGRRRGAGAGTRTDCRAHGPAHRRRRRDPDRRRGRPCVSAERRGNPACHRVGLMAASAILSAAGRYTRDQLDPYERRLRKRFGVSGLARLLSRIVPDTVAEGSRRVYSRPPGSCAASCFTAGFSTPTSLVSRRRPPEGWGQTQV